MPAVEKIGRLIGALRDRALREAGAFPGGCWAVSYCAPDLASWESSLWFELARDGEVAEFLSSGTYRAEVLLRSLQALMQWYGQAERDEMLRRMRTLN